jgi:hypothetical protein
MPPFKLPVVPRVRLLAPVRLLPTKVGVAPVLMFWTVLMAPEAAVKLVLLKLAIPLAAVVASLIVMVAPAPVVLAMLNAPVRASKLLTPPAPVQVPQDGATPTPPDSKQEPEATSFSLLKVVAPEA